MTARREVRTEESLIPIVYVVDDDPGMRAALLRLLTSAKIDAEAFASGREFLDAARFDRPGCIVLDVSMPGMSGPQVQVALKHRHVSLPVMFLTGSSDIPIAVTAMREGAVDFIEKPFDNDDLIARVRAAIEGHGRTRQVEDGTELTLARMDKLTPRERQVMEQVVMGRTSKEIARVIGSSYRTIEIHRGRVMEKMGAETLADLVRMGLLRRGDRSL